MFYLEKYLFKFDKRFSAQNTNITKLHREINFLLSLDTFVLFNKAHRRHTVDEICCMLAIHLARKPRNSWKECQGCQLRRENSCVELPYQRVGVLDVQSQ